MASKCSKASNKQAEGTFPGQVNTDLATVATITVGSCAPPPGVQAVASALREMTGSEEGQLPHSRSFFQRSSQHPRIPTPDQRLYA